MAIRVIGAAPEFVHIVLKQSTEHFQSAKTGIAIPGIGRKEILSLKVVLPPIAEQKRIVAKVDELMALCDRLEPFLALLIGAPEAREYLGSASVGTTMQNLNQGILAKMPVGVPPLAEQRRIVAKVDQLMSLVDQLETQLAESRTAATRLLEAAVAELTSFQG